MLNAFKHSFDAGYRKSIIIGSDCIEIDSELIEKAFDYLDRCDVIIGPSLDGGYYLIGTNKPIDIIFNNMKWSTENVLGETINRLKKNGLDYILLEYLNDIDKLKDLEKHQWLIKRYSII